MIGAPTGGAYGATRRARRGVVVELPGTDDVVEVVAVAEPSPRDGVARVEGARLRVAVDAGDDVLAGGTGALEGGGVVLDGEGRELADGSEVVDGGNMVLDGEEKELANGGEAVEDEGGVLEDGGGVAGCENALTAGRGDAEEFGDEAVAAAPARQNTLSKLRTTPRLDKRSASPCPFQTCVPQPAFPAARCFVSRENSLACNALTVLPFR